MNQTLMPFCFSVKKNTGDAKSCTKEIYEQYIKEMTTKYKDIQIKQVIYEHDKQQKRLHFHAVLICPKSFLRIKLRKEGWNVHYMLLNNAKAWEDYCGKEQTQQKKAPAKKSLFVKRAPPKEYIPTEEDEQDFQNWIDANQPWPPKDEFIEYTDEFIYSPIKV